MELLQSRGTGAGSQVDYAERGVVMRVSVYKLDGGRIDVMVEASPGNGKAPVVLQNVTKTDIKERLAPVVEAQRGRKPRAGGPA